MKHITLATFASRDDAENAINDLHRDLNIPSDEISFIYKNTEGDVKEVDADDVSTNTPAEGAKAGAWVGGTVGALAGLAAVAGMLPVIGPILVAGPLASLLGLGAGALGTTAAGAITGAAAGGLIGALVGLGVSENDAKKYEDQVLSGNILLVVHAASSDASAVASILAKHSALTVNSYKPAV